MAINFCALPASTLAVMTFLETDKLRKQNLDNSHDMQEMFNENQKDNKRSEDK
jgi:hypothetical protein